MPLINSTDVRSRVQNAFTIAFGASTWPQAEYVIEHESGFNPHAVNSSSGACGLGQALPCGKMGCGSLDDVDCQIKWLIGYFKDHYGTVSAAYQHELTYNWY